MTQKERIMDMLRTDGAITVLDVIRETGCTKPNARISELRQDGEHISHLSCTTKNRWGDHVTFYIHYLDGDSDKSTGQSGRQMALSKKRQLEAIK